jgi:hypothetical protein
MPTIKQSPTEQTIRKLVTLAQHLYQGADFAITRLTIIKRLCADSTAAAHFGLFIAERICERMHQQACPDYLAPEQWAHYQQLIMETVPQIAQLVAEHETSESATILRLLHVLEQEQNQYKHRQWGDVRMIQSKELLTVETALRCVKASHDTPYWCYQLAREYAERYDPRYGSGLIPESAPLVEDIAVFWCHYHYGTSLAEWLKRTGKLSTQESTQG